MLSTRHPYIMYMPLIGYIPILPPIVSLGYQYAITMLSICYPYAIKCYPSAIYDAIYDSSLICFQYAICCVTPNATASLLIEIPVDVPYHCAPNSLSIKTMTLPTYMLSICYQYAILSIRTCHQCAHYLCWKRYRCAIDSL